MRIARLAFLALALLAGASSAKSFVSVTSWPSFRLGNDLGRFDWYLDVQWWSFQGHDIDVGADSSGNEFFFEPTIGCNVQVYDSLFKVYLGGFLGTWLDFVDGEYSDLVNISVGIGGGIEVALTRKISVIGEYMFNVWFSVMPDNRGYYFYDYTNGFTNRPSVQLRYYIGPAQ